jgi:spore germination cell wall hydrolase CwlJ-like protein
MPDAMVVPPRSALARVLPLLGLALAVPAASPAAGADESDAQRCMALALYWEARDENREGMVAVGHVVLNRVKSRKFPADICAVVKQGGEQPPCQFGYWCDGKRDEPEPGAQWRLAQAVAKEMLSTPPADPTGGALYFHSVDDGAAWQKQRRRTAAIGRHVYYR